MSTNKTPNLKLHSWEPLDPFKREEINENFSWLDLAAGALDKRIVKLTDYTVPQDTNHFALDLTGHTWADHKFIVVRLTPGAGAPNSSFQVNLNSDTNAPQTTVRQEFGSTTWGYGFGNAYADYGLTMLLMTNPSGNRCVQGFLASFSLFYIRANSLSFSDLASMHFGHSGSSIQYFKAGTRLEIWGIM